MDSSNEIPRDTQGIRHIFISGTMVDNAIHKFIDLITYYRLILSKDKNTTASNFVEGWNYADGENVNSLGKGNDSKADGMIDVSVKDSDLKQVDFGINYLIQ